MCNRYHLHARADQLIDLFDLEGALDFDLIDETFYPGKPAPVIRQVDGSRRLEHLDWGFPPFKGTRPVNNTRSEGAAQSRFWSGHLGNRCVFPLSHAVEWQHQVNPRTGGLLKVPHTIGFEDDRIAAVAGIWPPLTTPGCCSMMTCRAQGLWATIHNASPDDPRMVCFLLQKPQMDAWLDPERPWESVASLLKPLPESPQLLVAQPVSLAGPRRKTRRSGEVDGPGLFG